MTVKQKWGTSRVQFVAVLEEIRILLDGACPKTDIYNQLVIERKISMKYCTFCKLIDVKFNQKYTRKRKNSASEVEDKEKGKKQKQSGSNLPATQEKSKILSVESNQKGVPFGSAEMSDDTGVI